MAQNILEIKDLHAAYEDTDVLKNVSLEVKTGEVFCIVGESGSGKSTLIRTICADSEIKVKSGSIVYKEKDLFKLKKADKKNIFGSEIGFIQQNPWGAFNPIRPLKSQFKETYKSHGKKLDEERLEKIFSFIGLKDADGILKKRPYELSGGMCQRVAIALSFALDPKILLCDEITSALDVTTQSAVTEELMRLKKDMGTTIILVTHNLGMASCIADRIAIMKDGRIVEQGDTREILNNPQNEYTKGLLMDVPKLRVV